MITTLTISPFQGLCFVALPLCSEGRYCEGRYCEGRYREGRYREGRYREGRYREGRYREGRYREGALPRGALPRGGVTARGRYRLADVCRPFRAMYCSPDGASSANDGHSPSDMIKHKKWDNHS